MNISKHIYIYIYVYIFLFFLCNWQRPYNHTQTRWVQVGGNTNLSQPKMNAEDNRGPRVWPRQIRRPPSLKNTRLCSETAPMSRECVQHVRSYSDMTWETSASPSQRDRQNPRAASARDPKQRNYEPPKTPDPASCHSLGLNTSHIKRDRSATLVGTTVNSASGWKASV